MYQADLFLSEKISLNFVRKHGQYDPLYLYFNLIRSTYTSPRDGRLIPIPMRSLTAIVILANDLSNANYAIQIHNINLHISLSSSSRYYSKAPHMLEDATHIIVRRRHTKRNSATIQSEPLSSNSFTRSLYIAICQAILIC